MIQRWIESIFIKRMALACAAAFIAQWAANLSLWGISIDQKAFADHLTVILIGLSQGLHEWLAAKHPEIGKYL